MNTAEKALVYRDTQFYWQKVAPKYIEAAKSLGSLDGHSVDSIALPLSSICTTGEMSPESMAKVLVTHAFHQKVKDLLREQLPGYVDRALEGYKSQLPGMTLRFTDQIDRTDKHVLLIADPDDAPEDLDEIRELLKDPALSGENVAVAFFQGSEKFYPEKVRALQEILPVYDGQEFWERFTGDPSFCSRITVSHVNTIAYRTAEILHDSIESLAKELQDIEI